MSVAVLVMTDGRADYLQRTVRTAMCHLGGPITEWWMYDDSGDPAHRADLTRRYPTFTHFHAGPRQGFGGAIRAAWARLATDSEASHIFHLEADFELLRPVDVGAMARALDARPYLVQMALRRQAWNDDERAAGGVIEQHPDAYTETSDWVAGAGRIEFTATWLEHTLFFTTNPSLYRITLARQGLWPHGTESEGHFSANLLRHGSPEATGDAVRFGFWGGRADGPWVEHIGVTRAGTDY